MADLRLQFSEAHPDTYLNRSVVAAGLCRSQSWLELAATRGGGPPFYKLGRRVLYKKSEVLEWMHRHLHRFMSTSEYAVNG